MGMGLIKKLREVNVGQQKNKKRYADNEAVAVLRRVKTAPSKINDVAKLIRGKKVSNALALLSFSHRRIALDVKKTLESAISNAENNNNLDIDTLVVAEAHVGKSLVLKRWKARARGRVGRIKKMFSHLTITVRATEN